jgi:DNA primase
VDKYSQLRTISFTVVAPALDIDISKFKRSKDEYAGPCPIHGGKRSSSFRYKDDGRFNCFAEGCKGKGALDLAIRVKNFGFQAAVEFLTALVGTEPPTTQKPALAHSESADGILKPLEKDTWRKYAVPCPWLKERIPDAAVLEAYGVFCYNNPARKSAYSGRIMLPVRNVQGVLYGYLGRSTNTNSREEDPKYLFPKNLPKSRFLFGAAEILAGRFGEAPLKRIWCVESPLCVLKYASLGLPAVSAFGWSVSEEQVLLLQLLTKGIVYLPDRNKHSECAAVSHRLANVLWLRSPSLPAGIEDPEHLTKEQILAL